MKELKTIKLEQLNAKELQEIGGGESGWYYMAKFARVVYEIQILPVTIITSGSFMDEPGAGGYMGSKT